MSIKFGLIPNHLTDDKDDYMGIVTQTETVDSEKIVEKMIGKGSSITKSEALAVIEEYEYAIVDFIKNGRNVITPLFRIHPSISGVFNDQSDAFDTKRHSLKLNLNPGSRLKEATSDIELRKVDITSPVPVLQNFIDLKKNIINESCTPGQIATIHGLLLKFDEKDTRQGIFFIKDDGTEVRVSNIAKNKPSELLFFVPDNLTAGSWTIEVRVTFHNSKTLKKGQLLNDITVAS
ncbi:MAG: DUF4469 domain-containing protein [Bacteroidales bacterium]|nr:DUF4469 domain-containing protein [Bacteroidales bacterium]